MAKAAGAPLLARVNPAVTRLICALLAIGLLGWAGVRARQRGDAARTELRTARGALDEFASLKQRYRPAVAAESIAWRRTWMELQALGVVGDEKLATTQQVARAAESAGLGGVKVLIGPADTTGAEKRLSTEGVERKSASYSLVVEGRGGMRSVVAFLGQLPPSVAPTQLTMARQSGSARHRITLAVYELQFTNGPPPNSLWSSPERRSAADSSSRRPNG
jgi:hypothetical protein